MVSINNNINPMGNNQMKITNVNNEKIQFVCTI